MTRAERAAKKMSLEEVEGRIAEFDLQIAEVKKGLRELQRARGRLTRKRMMMIRHARDPELARRTSALMLAARTRRPLPPMSRPQFNCYRRLRDCGLPREVALAEAFAL